jgi:O-antigen/teichoic acid export membrane protein
MTVAIGGVTGWGKLVPSLRMYRRVLGVIGFGIRFSANSLANVLYEQFKNVVIGAIGGVSALGLWSLATRMLQIPNLMYAPIHQVAFPAFSQLVASGRDPRPVLERVSTVSFAASALALPAFLVAAPGLITTVFGETWADAALVFPGLILAIFIAAPVAAPCGQFLFAIGRPSTVLLSTLIAVSTSLVSIAVLLSMFGLVGVGFGAVPAAVLESLILGRAVRQISGANVWAAMPSFLGIGLLAVGGGYVVTLLFAREGVAALLAAATAAAIAACASALTRRSIFQDLLSIGRRSVSSALAGGR